MHGVPGLKQHQRAGQLENFTDFKELVWSSSSPNFVSHSQYCQCYCFSLKVSAPNGAPNTVLEFKNGWRILFHLLLCFAY